ncbi:MAG: hypothetical protein P4M02_09310 [Clostridia bacterium]|nr:hypothetical protein [Clostridia bacterium]
MEIRIIVRNFRADSVPFLKNRRCGGGRAQALYACLVAELFSNVKPAIAVARHMQAGPTSSVYRYYTAHAGAFQSFIEFIRISRGYFQGFHGTGYGPDEYLWLRRMLCIQKA